MGLLECASHCISHCASAVLQPSLHAFHVVVSNAKQPRVGSTGNWVHIDECCCGQGKRDWSRGGVHMMCLCGPQTPACPRAGRPSSALYPHRMAPCCSATMDKLMSTIPCPGMPAAVSHAIIALTAI